jgi:hypothetical protein
MRFIANKGYASRTRRFSLIGRFLRKFELSFDNLSLLEHKYLLPCLDLDDSKASPHSPGPLPELGFYLLVFVRQYIYLVA